MLVLNLSSHAVLMVLSRLKRTEKASIHWFAPEGGKEP